MAIKQVVVDKANRIHQLPPDPLQFAKRWRSRLPVRRREIIDLARFHWPVGYEEDTQLSNDLSPATDEQIAELKEALAAWYQKEYDVTLNPTKEIWIGGDVPSLLFLISLVFIDTNDLAFVPEIGSPVYRQAVAACGGESVSYALNKRTNWQPSFARLHTQIGRAARLLFLNTPHDPTGTEIEMRDMQELTLMASQENILIVNDSSYSSIPVNKPVSLLSVEHGKRVGVEAGSFSLRFGLPQLPFGFVVGHRDVISGLQSVSGLVGTYLPACFVAMAVRAIRRYPAPQLLSARKRIEESVAGAIPAMTQLGLEREGGNSVPYIWCRLERQLTANDAAVMLFRRSRILVAPGTAFGEAGGGFVRLSATAPAESFTEAANRVRQKLQLLRLVADQ